MYRKASAVWNGGLRDGSGTISTESGALPGVAYSFSKRFENEAGTNPEELIAAAHAACFSMALSAQLEKAGMKPERIQTTAAVSLEKGPDGFVIPAVHLDAAVTIAEPDEAAFELAAERAKATCPVSRLLNAEITLNARLNPA
ncbi:MAG: OsmC family protein [Chthoniobacteraceae bacterium]